MALMNGGLEKDVVFLVALYRRLCLHLLHIVSLFFRYRLAFMFALTHIRAAKLSDKDSYT